MQMSANTENFALEVRGPRLRLNGIFSALLQWIHFASSALVHIEPIATCVSSARSKGL